MQARLIHVIALVLPLLAACATQPSPQHGADRLAAYTAAAGSPVNNFGYLQFYSWEALAPDQMVLYTKPAEAWLLTFRAACPTLQSASGISLSTRNQQISTNFDRVIPLAPGALPCTISEIRPVDTARVKAIQAEQRHIEVQPRDSDSATPASATH